MGVVPHRRWGGHVVIGPDGLVAGSWRTWNVRRFADADALRAAIERLIARSIDRFRPAVVVLGFLGRDRASALLDAAEAAARSLGVPVVRRSIEDARTLLFGRTRGTEPEALAHLATRVFPQLGGETGRGDEHEHFRRHAWNALAVAVAELASRFPFDVARMFQRDLPSMPQLSSTLVQAARPRDPETHAEAISYHHAPA